MRHYLFAGTGAVPLATLARSVHVRPAPACLVALPGGALTLAPGGVRALSDAVDVAPIAA